jgi:predicted phage terminase large subunit-like protein
MKVGSRNSFSVIQLWRPWNSAHNLIDQWRGQCSYSELYSNAKRMIVRHQPGAILIEESANGHALTSSLRPRYGALIRPIRPQGSKRSRLLRHIEKFLAGGIRLPSNVSWREDFVAECVAFPHGEYTDQVDAMTQYLDFIATNPILKAPSPRCGGVVVTAGGGFRKA